MKSRTTIRPSRAARLVAACAFVAACAALSSCTKRESVNSSNANSSNVAPSNSANGVVAVVDGREIPAKLYEMFLRNGREELGLDEATPEGRRALEKLREGVVEDLIDRALISEEAERRGLRVTPEMTGAREQREITGMGGDAKFKAFLEDHGLTREEYRSILRDELYGELMTKEAEKSAEVTGDEIKKYYDEHRDDPALRQPERIAASHILVAARPTQIAAQLEQERHLAGASLDAAVREESARRRQKAEELRRRAAAGEDFARLARENSDDDATKPRGGDLGTFARDTHARAFDEAAFALTKPGEVSPVVQTDFGFHVIKLTRREPARTLTLDEAAPDIRKRLAAEKRAKTLRDWLDAARKHSQVRVAEAFRFGALKDKYPAM
jgi:parvulin-like peptidyl-prolyl isomerase